MVLWARVTGIWFLSKIEKALRYAAQSLWRWKLRTEQHTATNKNLISPASLGRVTLFKSSRRMSFIFWRIPRARAQSLARFIFVPPPCAYARNPLTLLNFNLLFAVALVVDLHYSFIAIGRSELDIIIIASIFTSSKNTAYIWDNAPSLPTFVDRVQLCTKMNNENTILPFQIRFTWNGVKSTSVSHILHYIYYLSAESHSIFNLISV